jgi:hypothetical protein
MALQSVAWSRMLVAYSRGGQFISAVTKTFDGRHPCSLCKQIQRAKNGEPRPERAVEVENQAAFVAPALAALMRNEGVSWNLEIPEWRGSVRAEQPVTPPPRSVVA